MTSCGEDQEQTNLVHTPVKENPTTKKEEDPAQGPKTEKSEGPSSGKGSQQRPKIGANVVRMGLVTIIDNSKGEQTPKADDTSSKDSKDPNKEQDPAPKTQASVSSNAREEAGKPEVFKAVPQGPSSDQPSSDGFSFSDKQEKDASQAEEASTQASWFGWAGPVSGPAETTKTFAAMSEIERSYIVNPRCSKTSISYTKWPVTMLNLNGKEVTLVKDADHIQVKEHPELVFNNDPKQFKLIMKVLPYLVTAMEAAETPIEFNFLNIKVHLARFESFIGFKPTLKSQCTGFVVSAKTSSTGSRVVPQRINYGNLAIQVTLPFSHYLGDKVMYSSLFNTLAQRARSGNLYYITGPNTVVPVQWVPYEAKWYTVMRTKAPKIKQPNRKQGSKGRQYWKKK
jgi:hypothetical protein